MMNRIICLIVLSLSVWAWQSVAVAKEGYQGYQLVIKRSENKLLVKKDGLVMTSFHIAYGSGKGAKRWAGDRRTPVGEYKIIELRDSDKFHLFFQLNYPSVRDAMQGLREKRISQSEYRRIVDAHLAHRLPPQNTALGGSIGIHGIGIETEDKIDIHEVANWTKGCIALRNKEVDLLARIVGPGTPVIIEE